MEHKNKIKEEMDEKNNKIQNQSLQQEYLIGQLSNVNEEIMSLRFENEKMRNALNSERQINERLNNDLNSEKQLNERIMKSQVDMNQLNEKNLYRKKRKSRKLDTKKKVNLANKEIKRINDLLAVIVVR